MSLTWFLNKRFCKGENMVNEISQVGLVLLVIMPGYISYTFKEMWSIHREKTQFEKLLNSIALSVIIWIGFWLIFEKTPRYYLAEGSITQLIGKQGIYLMIAVFILSLIMTLIEKSRIFFIFGRFVGISIKEEHNCSLFDYIFNSPSKEIAEVHVYTDDGFLYRGLQRKKPKSWKLFCGTQPYSGDISFICDMIKAPGEDSKPVEPNKGKGFVKRTYIPKERIKRIDYIVK